MQSSRLLKLTLLLAASTCYPHPTRSDCSKNPAKFDDLVQPLAKSRKYRIASFIISDPQGNVSMQFQTMSSTILRTPTKTFLLLQKSLASPARTFCEVFTLSSGDPNGTLLGYYGGGAQDPGNDSAMHITGFELDKVSVSHRLLLKLCLKDNVTHRYTFELDSASTLQPGDFTLNLQCNVGEIRRMLDPPSGTNYTPAVVIILGAVGAFLLVQLVLGSGLVRAFGARE